MVRWREAVLLAMVSGFAWYLFLAPQQGPGAFDQRAMESLKNGRIAIETAGSNAADRAKALILR